MAFEGNRVLGTPAEHGAGEEADFFGASETLTTNDAGTLVSLLPTNQIVAADGSLPIIGVVADRKYSTLDGKVPVWTKGHILALKPTGFTPIKGMPPFYLSTPTDPNYAVGLQGIVKEVGIDGIKLTNVAGSSAVTSEVVADCISIML